MGDSRNSVSGCARGKRKGSLYSDGDQTRDCAFPFRSHMMRRVEVKVGSDLERLSSEEVQVAESNVGRNWR